MSAVLVRRERPADVAAVRQIVAAAFARPEAPERLPEEVGLLDRLRGDDSWLPALSLVATDPSGEVVGHVVCTRASVEGRPALGLGPLAVRPDRQRQGVGTALLHAMLGAAEALDEPLIGLLGDPAYYGRFGFGAASSHGIVAPDPRWGPAFQVRLFTGPAMSGVFTYAQPFNEL